MMHHESVIQCKTTLDIELLLQLKISYFPKYHLMGGVGGPGIPISPAFFSFKSLNPQKIIFLVKSPGF